MFNPLSDKPDHPALELEILALWEQEQTFEQLRDRNRGRSKRLIFNSLRSMRSLQRSFSRDSRSKPPSSGLAWNR
jgi:hypothetical protein